MTTAENLRDYLRGDHSIKTCVGSEVWIEAEYPDCGQASVVVYDAELDEPRDALRICYRAETRGAYCMLRDAVQMRIEELPLGEVISRVSLAIPFNSGRMTVRPGICGDVCPA